LKSHRLFTIALALVAVFVLESCNTAGELPQGPVTPLVPPPGAAETRAAQPTSALAQADATMSPATIPTAGAPVPVSLPQQLPVAQRGQGVYEVRCAACHGAAGKGDGPQSQQIVANMGGKFPDFSDPAYVRSVKPTDWFNVISNGRLQKGMPPFTGLTADDRWDVVSYLYTLSISQDQLDQGKTVYVDKCASCHGATGKSDNPATPDLSDASKMADKSQADLDTVIANGQGTMPGFSSVSQADRQAVADYVRSLSMDLLKIAAPKGEASITGFLVNGTPNGKAPGNLPVTLYALSPDGSSLIYTRTVTADAAGNFTFDKLDTSTPAMYGLQTQYLKATYTSDALTFAHGGLTLTTPITVYETTSDASNISIEQMHMFFDFVSPGSTTVGQLYILSNSGDRAYVGSDGLSARFQLPAGATGVRFMDGDLGGRYKSVDNGFADTEAVAPGTGTTQILVSYDLPYNGKKLDLKVPIAYPAKSVNVLVPEGGAKLTSPQLTESGTRPTQGGNMVNFVGSNLAAGSSLALQLSGAPSTSGAGVTASGNQTVSPILIVAAALLLVAVAIVVFVWLRQRQQAEWVEEEVEDAEAEQDELLDAIAKLDDDFEAGRIQEADYRRERAELKAELKELMNS